MATKEFSARVVSGSGRGQVIGTPTLNLKLEDLPKGMKQGIYACMGSDEAHGEFLPAVMHYGPRPVFGDSTSCEVHFLDALPAGEPKTLHIRLVSYLREVRNFLTMSDLMEQIDIDVEQTKKLLERL